MRSYKAYLFDADGTLFDTRELIYRSFCAVSAAYGRPDPEREFIDGLIGLPFPPQIKQVLDLDSDEEFDAAIEFYRRSQIDLEKDYLRVFPGVVEGLAELSRRGARMAVVTSRSLLSLPRFLTLLDGPDGPGRDLFDTLVTPESTDRHKPEPEPVLRALEVLRVAPEDAVMIGDARFDIEAGARAGVDTVLVSWGGMSPQGWPYQPDRIINEFSDLLG